MAAVWNLIAQRCFASTTLILLVSILISSFPQSTCAPTPYPPTENITITVPAGTHNFGNQKILCFPSKWTDVATFFVANFVAHAATVKSVPGEPNLSVALSVISALFFPASGILRALNAIYQHTIFAKSPLETAKRAGALCMVVRTSKWEPQPGDIVDCHCLTVTDQFKSAVMNKPQFEFLKSKEYINSKLIQIINKSDLWRNLFLKAGLESLIELIEDSAKTTHSEVPALVMKSLDAGIIGGGMNADFKPSTSRYSRGGRIVHGTCNLPRGYKLSIVPPDAEVSELGKYQSSERPFCQRCSSEDRTKQEQTNEENSPCDRNDNDDSNKEQSKGIRRTIERSYEYVKDKQEDYEGKRRKLCYSHILPMFFLRVLTKIFKLKEDEFEPQNTLIGDAEPHKSELSSNYNLPKGLVAIFQLVYASATLYRVRGDQVERYGYAAFALTVAPYLVMSIVNLISNLVTPDYPTVYLVSSEVMEEALKREGAKFEGAVGLIKTQGEASDIGGKVKTQVEASDIGGKIKIRRIWRNQKDDEHIELDLDSSSHTQLGKLLKHVPAVVSSKMLYLNPHRKPKDQTRLGKLMSNASTLFLGGQFEPSPIKRPTLVASSFSESEYRRYKLDETKLGIGLVCASVIITSISILINGAFSSFDAGHSTVAQRVWTMTWLAFGISFAPFAILAETVPFSIKLLWIFSNAAPAIGGFVVVGQMLKAYGDCIQVSNSGI